MQRGEAFRCLLSLDTAKLFISHPARSPVGTDLKCGFVEKQKIEYSFSFKIGKPLLWET